jgi:AraC family transcriptional regulator
MNAAVATLLDTPLLKARDSRLHCDAQGPGPARGGEGAHLVLVRRGCFAAQVGRRHLLADPATALLYDDGADYRISQPAAGGDDCLLVEPAEALREEIFGKVRGAYGRTQFRLSPAAVRAHAATLRLLWSDRCDPLAKEEAAVALLAAVRACEGTAEADGLRRRGRRAVARVRALLHDDLSRNLGIAALAREADCSPFHLMRLFREETGLTLRSYRSRVRASMALYRIAQGERDLSALAADIGFSSHAHMTDTMRMLFGEPPRRLRAALQALDEAANTGRRTP